MSRLTGLLFNEISDRIPSVLIPGIVKTVEMIESVETSVATHASMVEILIYWENYSYEKSFDVFIL